MTLSTVTLTDIIGHLADVIEDLTPSADPTDVAFVRSSAPNREPLRRWVPDAGGNVMFRRFEIRRDGQRQDLGVIAPDAALVEIPLLVTVCYPASHPTNYGLDDLAELEATIESDVLQIRNAIFNGTGLYGSGHLANFVDVLGLDQADEAVWFQDIAVNPQFYIAQ